MAIWVFSKGGGFKLFTLCDVFSYHTLFMGLVGKEKTVVYLLCDGAEKCAFLVFSLPSFRRTELY